MAETVVANQSHQTTVVGGKDPINQLLVLEEADGSEAESEEEQEDQEDEDESDNDSLSDAVTRVQGDLGSAWRTPANRRRIPSPGNQGDT